MGHRANYVFIRDGSAAAYYDWWGATSCLKRLAGGPDAVSVVQDHWDQVDRLLDGDWGEGGYLLDFDRHFCIASGHLPLADDAPYDEMWYTERGPHYLREIAPKWPGWRLILTEYGQNAFADYSRERGITNIESGERGHYSGATVEYEVPAS